MDSQLTLDRVAARMRVLAGLHVDDVKEVACFAGNQVFRLLSGSTELFLKTGAAEDVRSEAAVLSMLASRDIPVAIVEAIDRMGEVVGRPALLLRGLEGRSLDGSERFVLAGSHLRALHDIRLVGYGTIEPADEGLVGNESAGQMS